MIDVLDADNVVRVKTAGSHTPEDIDRMTVEALEIGKRHGLDRYLVDDRKMVPNFSTLQIYNLPKRLLKLGVPRETRVAVIIAGDSPKLDDFNFFKDRLVTFGQLDFQVFVESEESALSWLRGGAGGGT